MAHRRIPRRGRGNPRVSELSSRSDYPVARRCPKPCSAGCRTPPPHPGFGFAAQGAPRKRASASPRPLTCSPRRAQPLPLSWSAWTRCAGGACPPRLQPAVGLLAVRVRRTHGRAALSLAGLLPVNFFVLSLLQGRFPVPSKKTVCRFERQKNNNSHFLKKGQK